MGGTTGAGKSELLRTVVAGLAVRARPDDLTFVLVDYKGGSAFRECATLPHVLRLADSGPAKACAADPALASGLSTRDGELFTAEVGAALDLEVSPNPFAHN